MRELLSRFYPFHRGYDFFREQRDRWHYHWLRRRHGVLLHPERSSKTAREILAVDLLRRVTEQNAWVPDSLYPGAGGAADHKLLYVLVRALTEYGFRNVLELGAGETSRVLDAYAAHSGASVTTVEHDAGWVDRLSRDGVAPTHRMVHAELAPFHDRRAGRYRWYDLNDVAEPESPYDLILVDGPPGAPRWSRYGALAFLDRHRAAEFVVLWDDVDRVGELQSFGAWISDLRRAGIEADHHLFVSERTLGAVFTPKFASLRYFF